MPKLDTITVYYGTDTYIINASELKAYQEKGFTKKPSKAAQNVADNTEATETTNEAEKGDSGAAKVDSGDNPAGTEASK